VAGLQKKSVRRQEVKSDPCELDRLGSYEGGSLGLPYMYRSSGELHSRCYTKKKALHFHMAPVGGEKDNKIKATHIRFTNLHQ